MTETESKQDSLGGEFETVEIIDGEHILQRRCHPDKEHNPWYAHAPESDEHAVTAVVADADTLEVLETESCRWIGDGSVESAYSGAEERALRRVRQ